MDPESLDRAFTYQKPATDAQKGRHVVVRASCGAAARSVLENTPAGAEQNMAILKLREAASWANAAIAMELPGSEDLRSGADPD